MGKKLLMAVMAMMLNFFLTSATVEAKFPWTGAQLQTVIGGKVPIFGDKIFFRGSFHTFLIPKTKCSLAFAYAGPLFVVNDWLSVAPQFGVASNWAADGDDMFLSSLWNTLSFAEEKITFFLEGDVYVDADQKDYYGYYSADYNPAPSLNFGLQAEEVNKNVIFGPHVGFTAGPWHLELQYYVGLQEANKGHAYRFSTSVSF